MAFDPLSMTITKKIQGGHSEHDHEFELHNYNKPFTCDGCKELGFGSRYRCNRCDYDLHRECKFPNSTITLDLFKCSKFEFFDEPQTECGIGHCKKHARACDACGKDINGFSYHCQKSGYDLHPCCSNLADKLCFDDTVFKLRKEGLPKCEWCKKKKLFGSKAKVQGCSYVSRCENYNFHVYCVTEMVLEAWKKGAIDDVNSLDLEKMDLRLVRKSNRSSSGRGSVFWRTMKIFLSAILSVLVGDPTMILASVVMELISK